MQIIYRKQLPGKPPTESRIEGWVAAIIGAAILIGLLLLVIFLLPAIIFGAVAFFGFLILLMVVGWFYLAAKIGFRDMWNITTLLFGGRSWEEKRRRVAKEWEDKSKGKPGVWIK